MAPYKRTILGTCCVPWNADGSLAEETFRASIHDQITRGIPDQYIFGTAGEGYAVTEAQFDTITRIFAEEMRAGGSEPMVGVISLSLRTIIERIERANALGVRQFQISLPSWGALNEREMLTFFKETCGRFPDSQFLHYNLPRTKRLVMPEEYARLVRLHPNLVAIKYGGADLTVISGILRLAPELRLFLGDGSYPLGCMLGEPGLLVSIATSNPPLARHYFELGVAGDMPKLMAMRQELMGMLDELYGAMGTSLIDGAYDKVFSKIRLSQFPLRLLPPYEHASEEQFAKYCAALRARYRAWIV
ncbi:MAG: dihydrodipicolinate synthase family protein [Chloroflexi bacterium]|nr:dihydrodipicolinate synthase family protein [Chloroflexota bacterium]